MKSLTFLYPDLILPRYDGIVVPVHKYWERRG
jgi:hypothetical protein